MTQPLEIQKRRYLSAKEKAEVVERQNRRCGCGCGDPLEAGQIDFDHRIDLAFGGSNDIDNFVALIRKHHLAKSASQNTVRAKCDRMKAKNEGRWLNAKDRALARMLDRTKQLSE